MQRLAGPPRAPTSASPPITSAACSACSSPARRRVDSFAKVMACDVERFKRFFHGMLDEGIYLAPSAFEAGFLSAAHSAEDIDARWRRGLRAGWPWPSSKKPFIRGAMLTGIARESGVTRRGVADVTDLRRHPFLREL
jgi:hypothetical protein